MVIPFEAKMRQIRVVELYHLFKDIPQNIFLKKERYIANLEAKLKRTKWGLIRSIKTLLLLNK